MASRDDLRVLLQFAVKKSDRENPPVAWWFRDHSKGQKTTRFKPACKVHRWSIHGPKHCARSVWRQGCSEGGCRTVGWTGRGKG